ncbi:MAG: hypothetical protein V2B18_24820 [Pseudomonadota bacterium]
MFQQKILAGKTDEGSPLRSSKTLMQYLSNVTPNAVRSPGVEKEVYVLATPTPGRRKALEILGAALRLQP